MKKIAPQAGLIKGPADAKTRDGPLLETLASRQWFRESALPGDGMQVPGNARMPPKQSTAMSIKM